MANNFGKGIKITSGFDLSAKGPIDNRIVVDTLTQRNEHVTAGRAYEGLQVFVTSTQKMYVYTSTGWIESGGITEEQLSQLTAAYAHSMTEHVSSEEVDQIKNKIEGLPTADSIREMVDTKADVVHNHNELYYDKEEIDQKIVDAVTNGQVDLSNYATISDLAAKADLGHVHTMSDMPGLLEEINKKADKDNVVTADELATKADANHEHDISGIKNLQETLDSKVNSASVYNKTELNIKFAELNQNISSKAELVHNHNELYYKKDEVDSAITKAVTDGKVDLSGYATLEDLARKSDIDHNHDTIYAKKDHEHDIDCYTRSEIDTFLANKSDSTHLHNDMYYTQAQVDKKLSDVATNGQLSLEAYATKQELSESLAAKANLSHSHTPSEIEGIEDILPDTYTKQEIDTAIVTAKTEAMTHANTLHTDLLEEASEEFNTLGKIEDKFSELKSNIDSNIKELEDTLSTKSEVGHGHDISGIKDLQEALDSKANKNDVNNSNSEIKDYVDKQIIQATTESNNYTDREIVKLIDSAPEAMDTLNELATAIKKNKDIYDAYVEAVSQQLESKADISHHHNGVYANASHTHELDDLTGLFDNVYTEDEVDDFLALKSDVGHLHNDVYYTQDEVDERIQSGVDKVDLTGLATKSELTQGLATKAELNHNHAIAQVNGLRDELDNKINASLAATKEELKQGLDSKAEFNHKHEDDYAAKVHNHDDLYFTKGEIEEQLKDSSDTAVLDALIKANLYTDQEILKVIGGENDKGITTITGAVNELINHESDFNKYKDEVDSSLSGKAPIEHEHGMSDITNLNSTIDDINANINKKADAENVYTKEEVDTALDSKAELSHNHDSSYSKLDHVHTTDEVTDLYNNIYKKNEIESFLSAKADAVHGHSISQISNLQEALDSKVNKADAEEQNNELKEYVDNQINQAKTEAKNYTDGEVLELIDNAPDAMNTLNKLATVITNNKTACDNQLDNLEQQLATKADIGHHHNGVYAYFSHTHELTDLNGLEDRLGQVQSDAISQAVADSNNYTDGKISAIVGGDGSSENTLTGLANKLAAHEQVFEEYQSTVSNALSEKAEINHGHSITNITGLQEALDLKANKAEMIESNNILKAYVDDQRVVAETNANLYTDREIIKLIDNAPDTMNTLNKIACKVIDNKQLCDQYSDSIAEQLETKADMIHSHDGVYANFSHTHELTDLNGLDSKLDKIKSDAISQAVADANNHTDDRISEIIGNTSETVESLATELNAHKEECTAYKNATNTALAQKAPINHSHDISNVTGLQDALDLKANKSELDFVGTNIQAAIDAARILAETNANNYTDQEIAVLVDSAPDAMNTLNELATAIKANKDIYDAYVETVSTALAGKSDTNHVHEQYVTKENLESEIGGIDFSDYAKVEDLSQYAKVEHNHNDLYAPIEHSHDILDVEGLSDTFYDKDDIDAFLGNKSDANHKHDDTYSKLNHEHTLEDIPDLTENYYTKEATDELLLGKADVSHNHDTIYYRKYLVDAKINALGIDGYAKLEDLTTWASQFALKNHTHDEFNTIDTSLTQEEVDLMLLEIFGSVE